MNREIQLQHDIHNSLDRLSEQLTALDKFNRSLSAHLKDPDNNPMPHTAVSYVVAEHVRSHITNTRMNLDKYYQSGKEVEP